MKNILFISSVLWLCLSLPSVAGSDYHQRADVKQFIQDFAAKEKLDPNKISTIIAQGEKQQKILDAISRPAEKSLNWGQYRHIFLEPKRLQQGIEFWREYETVIDNVAKKYQVAPEIIVAIIGVETRYGRLTGSYRVLDALLTLGFDYPKRGKFFRGQLEQFLLLTQEQGLSPLELKGSYAGAMGYGQFIPGSYRAYAADYEGDGVIDIWNNPADAIASVANYFAKHRWSYGDLVAVPLSPQNDKAKVQSLVSNSVKPKTSVASLRKSGLIISRQIADEEKVALLEYETTDGMEYWLAFDNFYSITRYNRSQLYAMATFQFSQLLKTHRHFK